MRYSQAGYGSRGGRSLEQEIVCFMGKFTETSAYDRDGCSCGGRWHK